MLDKTDIEGDPNLRALNRKRKITYASLLIEKITEHTWRPFFWIIFFSGLWMLDLSLLSEGTLKYITPLIFIIGLIYLSLRDIRTFQKPDINDINKRLEQNSTIPRGSISALNDSLANPRIEFTRTLWSIAQNNIKASFKHLRPPTPRAILARNDPSALRFIAILIFIIGLIFAGDQWDTRITKNLFPFSYKITKAPKEESISIWITPPSYTGYAQTFIDETGTYNDITIPEGSTIRVRLKSKLGGLFTPYLNIGNQSTELTPIGNNLFELKDIVIEQSNQIKITQALIPFATINYTYKPDTPPTIQLSESESTDEETKPPYEIIEQSKIRIPLTMRDDYGVQTLDMKLEIDPMVDHVPLGETFQETRLIMSPANQDYKSEQIYDLTWHPWAGLPVTIEYTAKDHKDQTATLDKIKLILPEREFKHPMAKSLIAIRKKIAWNYDESFMTIAQDLHSLLSAPDYFQNDLVIFMAIHTASLRLVFVDNKRQPERIKAANAIIKLLWDAAITIEDGELATAMRDLRTAQRNLENAMRNPNTPQDEIARLMEELNSRIENYFKELQREMQKRAESGEQFPQYSAEDFAQMITPGTMQNMLAEIEKALREGDKKKAQELMSKLQRLMEMIDPSMKPNLPKDMQVMQEGVNELQELIERQEQLLEQTKIQADIGREYNQQLQIETMPPIDIPNLEKMLQEFGLAKPPQLDRKKIRPVEPTDEIKEEAKKKSETNKTEQEALRYILGQLMLDAAEHIGEIPESMGKAEQEMRLSENALGDNLPIQSIPHQELAIKYLKESQDQLSEQLQQRMQQLIGIGLSGDFRRDPLGRPYRPDGEGNGASDQSKVKIPDEAQKKKVDEILRTLRDRSGDRSLPREDREYFRRLLNQY